MFDWLNDAILATAGSPWIYLIVLFGVCADAFFPPIPSETVVVAAAALGFATGAPNPWIIMALTGGFALVALFLLSVPGPYSPDMYENLNPPTICLILLGIDQLMLFTLLRNRLRAVAERPRIGALVDRVGARSMTIYLWHMPVIILLAAGLLILHLTVAVPLPDPLSAGWWLTRPFWLLAGRRAPRGGHADRRARARLLEGHSGQGVDGTEA
ncbi:acyltransferase family protein [Mycetocola saprophilus]|uniref:acyltransferase family protein n=1 Tax=Mycetocola saprophilus TaxID=76636 RepID=UPI0004BFA33C|nr:acyltransferase family protein [Mycetocola saprophilus]